MRNIILLITLSFTIHSFAQNHRIDSIRALDKLKIESRKTSKKIYISSTDRSVIPPSSHLFSNAFGEILELDVVKTIDESDFIFDCTIKGTKEAANVIISVYNSKSGEFVSTTKSVRSSDFEEMEMVNTRVNYHQKALEKCILRTVLPLFLAINRDASSPLPKIKGNNDIAQVVVLTDIKYAEGMAKGNEVKASIPKSSKMGLQEKKELLMNKVRTMGAQRYSPLVIITEWEGLGGDGILSCKAICFKNKE
jgi:hypothetical protein